MSLPSQQPLTVSELSMLRELFARIDTDGDGKIDIDNLKEAFKQNGWELTEHEAKVGTRLFYLSLVTFRL